MLRRFWNRRRELDILTGELDILMAFDECATLGTLDALSRHGLRQLEFDPTATSPSSIEVIKSRLATASKLDRRDSVLGGIESSAVRTITGFSSFSSAETSGPRPCSLNGNSGTSLSSADFDDVHRGLRSGSSPSAVGFLVGGECCSDNWWRRSSRTPKSSWRRRPKGATPKSTRSSSSRLRSTGP